MSCVSALFEWRTCEFPESPPPPRHRHCSQNEQGLLHLLGVAGGTFLTSMPRKRIFSWSSPTEQHRTCQHYHGCGGENLKGRRHSSEAGAARRAIAGDIVGFFSHLTKNQNANQRSDENADLGERKANGLPKTIGCIHGEDVAARPEPTADKTRPDHVKVQSSPPQLCAPWCLSCRRAAAWSRYLAAALSLAPRSASAGWAVSQPPAEVNCRNCHHGQRERKMLQVDKRRLRSGRVFHLSKGGKGRHQRSVQ
mmetsp:Transcript_14050/g.52707  ORF Transcript_14050/g.52707 Transcript_14050/m.52707 type:complete len:252 (-) Transcript_14050:792-1547(-)|eukprot:scaffold743_cov267-Pinguiococcus_pyrenoidosus.AAC.5